MKKKVNKKIDYAVLKRDWLFVNIVVGSVVLLTFIYMVVQKIGVIPSFPCPIHEILRVYCPGCGGTRAIFAMLQGHILQSLYYNPAILLGTLLVLHYEIGVMMTLVKKNGKRYYCNNIAPVVLYIVIIAVFSVVRNYLLVTCGIDMLQDFIPAEKVISFHLSMFG